MALPPAHRLLIGQYSIVTNMDLTLPAFTYPVCGWAHCKQWYRHSVSTGAACGVVTDNRNEQSVVSSRTTGTNNLWCRQGQQEKQSVVSSRTTGTNNLWCRHGQQEQTICGAVTVYRTR